MTDEVGRPKTSRDQRRATIRRWVEEISVEADPHIAFQEATDLVDDLREGERAGAGVRATAASRIHQAEALSLAGLANKLGMSKARAEQLVNAAKRPATPDSEETPDG